ncbi:MAG: acetylxylan esterase, partial [Spirochaetia bacterium]|nr:acetylxylan esterase [Spirochaetia bacterium]
MIPALAPLTGGAYKLEELLGIGLPGVEPDDYEIFWRESHVASVRTPLRDERLEVPGTSENHLFEKIFFNTAGGFRIGAWLAIPKKSAPRAVVVHSHGYGELKDPSPDFSDAVQCWVSAPGIALSARDDLPADPARHVLHGIASRETYLLRFCAAALWSAATYLSRRFPSFGDHLYYHGVSFSAGVGAMMLPWEPRFKKAVLELPTFGHHPLRFLAPSTGSAAAVQQYREDHREVDG